MTRFHLVHEAIMEQSTVPNFNPHGSTDSNWLREEPNQSASYWRGAFRVQTLWSFQRADDNIKAWVAKQIREINQAILFGNPNRLNTRISRQTN